ncbi:hypothetical protein MAM1_0218c08200 [Mucor ambiguus]|uniref:Uncharacterized protein n=1 Tax=Mucor ambiguus TaxID=91626 RepID=A0A0C9LWK5_9FUNG|nr:hypothetical protein MAM1_0218c08200 [Mucor ambiguus]
MTKYVYIQITLAAIGLLYLLFGPRQLFFQLCHQMKLHHVVAAPETLYIESVADNFYKAIFFQLNTYKLINHCQPRSWNYRKPFEFLKSIVSTLIKGYSDLDSALIKELGSKYTTGLHVAFQQKVLERAASRNSIYLYFFFLALFFKDTIQSVAISAYNIVCNYAIDCYFACLNIAAANSNNSNSGSNGGGPDGRGGSGSSGGNLGGNSGGSSGSKKNAGISAQKKYKTEATTRRKHLPTDKKPVAKQAASSSKTPSNIALSSRGPSSPKVPSSSNVPIINIDNAAIRQAEKEYKEAFVKFQASFTEINLTKANLERTFSKYQGLVNSLKKNYKPKQEIPLPDMTSATLDQYLAGQEELGAQLRYVARTKGKSADLLYNLTNQLRFARIETDKLKKQLQGYDFGRRDPFELLTKETLSQTGAPKPHPGPSRAAAPVKKHFKTDEEGNEYLRNLPRHKTTFEDVDYAQVKAPYYIAIPPEEFDNYRFPPGAYIAPILNREIPSTSAKIESATSLPQAQEQQEPQSSKKKGKQPMYPRARDFDTIDPLE